MSLAWLLSSVAFILAGKVQQLQVSHPDPEDQPGKNPVPIPAQRRRSLVQICLWSWRQGSFLLRHTEPGPDPWGKGRWVLHCALPAPHPGAVPRGETHLGSGRSSRAEGELVLGEEGGRESGAQDRP